MKTRKSSRLFVVAIAVGLMFVLSACGMGGVKVPDPPAGDPPPGDDVTYIWQEDFTQLALGPMTEEGGWSISNGDGAYGNVEVVEDSGVDTGRALRVTTLAIPGPSEDRSYHNLTVNIPTFSDLDDATTVGLEYKIRVVNSTGMNVYLTKSGTGHIIVNGVGGKKLTYSKDGWHDLGEMPDEWHTIRVMANKATGTADVYLNDVLVGDAIQLREAVDSWTDSRLQLLTTTSPTVTKEVLWADLKVWAVD